MTAFAWQDELATFADDSVSYLTLAHYFAGTNAFAAEWAGHHSNFPPLFPLLLAVTGGASNLHVAYVGLALCAAGGIAIFYRYAARELGERGGLVAALLFLACSTAWVSLKGVLSEPLYLLVSMAGLWYYESRLSSRAAPAWQWALFGFLLALACLSRVAGFFLVGAFITHWIVSYVSRRQRLPNAAWIALVPPIVMFGLWQLLRPRAEFEAYAFAAQAIGEAWIADPVASAAKGWQFFWDAWIRSFVADHTVSAVTKLIFAIVGVAALAGTILRARANRIDAWYALFVVAFVFAWPFSAENSRRLLYPVLPLLILHAALLVRRAGPRAAIAAAALPVLLCVPALVLIAQKSLDRRIVVEGCPQELRQMYEYYATLNEEEARQAAAVGAKMLCGLRRLDHGTAPDAVVMWMRPEYVAVLGKRKAVPYRFIWKPPELAAEIRRRDVGYLVVAGTGKADQAGMWGPALSATPFAQPAFILFDGFFVVERIDRAALERYLAQSR